MQDLNGKRILIAGGTGTVGRHMVNAQLEAGATVVVLSRSQAKLDTLTADIPASHRPRFVGLTGDVTDESDADRLLRQAGTLDGAIASIGRFIAAPVLLDAPRADLERAFVSYTLAHFAAAKSLLPALEEKGGGYVMINGSLAFEPGKSGTGIVSIAGASQSMLARVLMTERAAMRARINEIIIYSNLRPGSDEANEVKGADIGRYVSYLLSDDGRAVKGQTIHLRSREDLAGAGIP